MQARKMCQRKRRKSIQIKERVKRKSGKRRYGERVKGEGKLEIWRRGKIGYQN